MGEPTKQTLVDQHLWDSVSRQLAQLTKPSAPNLRFLSRQFSRLLHDSSVALILELANKLLDSHISGARFIAYDLLVRHPATVTSLTPPQIKQLARVLDDWGSVDVFACYIAGPAWRRGQLSLHNIKQWARSPNRWWRRAALVATVPLNVRAQGGTGDTAQTLAICRLLHDDRDDMVVKALSWALRSLSIHDANAVLAFLDEYKQTLAPRICREVTSKLKTGRKINSRAASK